MDIKSGTESVSFQLLRKEVALLYDLYFEYVTKKKKEGPFVIPDTFLLTAAFSFVFDGLTFQSGYVFFLKKTKMLLFFLK